jgi:MFS family permease
MNDASAAPASRAPNAAGPGSWGVVLACFVCQLGLGYAYLFSPLLREVTADLGWSRAEFAAARAPYFFVLAGASALLGHWSVRFGARPILVVSALCLGATFWLMSGMERLSELYLANLLYGLFMAGLGDVVVAGVLTRHVAQRRGLALGVALAASNVGGMLVPLLFAALVEADGWRSALQVLAAAGTVVILPFAWIAGTPARSAPGAGANDAGAHHDALELRAALRTRTFWILLFALAGYFFYFVGMNDSFISLLTDAGMTRVEAAGYYAAAVGAGGLSKLLVGLLADRLAPKTALIIDYGLLLASSLCLTFLPDQPFLLLFLVSYGLGVAARDVVYPLVIASSFGERTMARIYGVMLLPLAIAGPLGSVVTQAVYDRTGSYDPAFVGYALLNLVVLASLVWVRSELRPRGRR